MAITHAKVSAIPDGADATVVRPSDWNADHVGDFVTASAGAGAVSIPGLAGDVNAVPASPNAADDEFDTTDSDPIAGWTTLGTPTHDTNTTALSRYYLSAPDANLHGIYKAAPSFPFTVTVEMADYLTTSASGRASLALLEAGGTGKILTWGFETGTPGTLIVDLWTNRTTYGSTQTAGSTVNHGIRYLRYVVTSSTSILPQFSFGGHLWWDYGVTLNPGLTVAAFGIIAAFGTTKLMSDWIRVT